MAVGRNTAVPCFLDRLQLVGPVRWGLVKMRNVVECVLAFALLILFSCFSPLFPFYSLLSNNGNRPLLDARQTAWGAPTPTA